MATSPMARSKPNPIADQYNERRFSGSASWFRRELMISLAAIARPCALAFF
jgi:hypothetical protein